MSQAVMMQRAEWWGGKEVWVVLDSKDGLWRQATVVCAVPPPLSSPLADWHFVVDSHHDGFRHICLFHSANGGEEFDLIKLTDAALMPSKDDPYKKWTAPAWFDIVPEGSPVYKVKDGSVSVHPYISQEIIELRRLYNAAQQTIETLTLDLQREAAESSQKSLQIDAVKSALQREKDERASEVAQLTAQLDLLSAANAELTQEKTDLVKEAYRLKALINEMQEENNKLRTRLKLMTDELVKFKVRGGGGARGRE